MGAIPSPEQQERRTQAITSPLSSEGQELVAAYKAKREGMSARDQAQWEDRIWLSLPPKTRTWVNDVLHSRGPWLNHLLGEGIERHAVKYMVLHFERKGLVVELAWQQLEQGIRPGALKKALGVAKRRSQADPIRLSFQRAFEEEIEKPTSSRRSTPSDTPKRKPQEHIPRGPIYGHLKDGLRSPIGRVPPETDAALYQEAEEHLRGDIRVALEEYRRALQQARRRGRRRDVCRRVFKMTPAKLHYACDMLSVSYPEKGGPVDLVRARKNRNKMIRLYHPDHNNGDRSREGLLEDVRRQYDLLAEYNRKQGV